MPTILDIARVSGVSKSTVSRVLNHHPHVSEDSRRKVEEAIKEEFILDVLKGYMSFSRYYKLVRKKEFADKEYDKKKTVRLLTSY